MGYKPQEDVPEHNRMTNTGQNPPDMTQKTSAINEFMFSQEEGESLLSPKKFQKKRELKQVLHNPRNFRMSRGPHRINLSQHQ